MTGHANAFGNEAKSVDVRRAAVSHQMLIAFRRSPIIPKVLLDVPSPQGLRRLDSEYSLAAELEPAWAAKPLAFQTLIRRILVKSEAEVGQWQHALQEVMGPNGQLIINLISELAFIIGRQSPFQICRRWMCRTASSKCSGASLPRSPGQSTRSCCSSTISNGWTRQLLNCWSACFTTTASVAGLGQ